MASKIKINGNVGNMLTAMANRNGSMTCDHRGFPPSHVMLPLRRRGLVELKRTGLPRSRYNIWHLTQKGWDAIGRAPQEIADT
jgi:hypothetical protein